MWEGVTDFAHTFAFSYTQISGIWIDHAPQGDNDFTLNLFI